MRNYKLIVFIILVLAAVINAQTAKTDEGKRLEIEPFLLSNNLVP